MKIRGITWHCCEWILTVILHSIPVPQFTAYTDLVENATDDITVFTSSQKGLSFQRKYFDNRYGVFPHLTAIIDVKNGVSATYL